MTEQEKDKERADLEVQDEKAADVKGGSIRHITPAKGPNLIKHN